ncbi:glutaredoxin family protein [Microbacterium sp. bgisy207]|uniref:glutaredoxin family protein n=1 Tax=Microbacterium sp. bgisy207 TaxID=3413800 RepID=UPI003EC10E64
MTLTLIGRDGCHLCEVARGVIDQVLADLPDSRADQIELVDVSVDADPALREQWGEKVPVILVDGRLHSYWRVDATRLKEALEPSREPVS